MTTLKFLEPYGEFCQLDQLQHILAEREQWWGRKNEKVYAEALTSLPKTSSLPGDFSQSWVKVGDQHSLESDSQKIVEQAAKALIPWRKGPFSLCGMEIDAEWRSDVKWDRLASSLGSLKGKKILDIGCNNGYYMFRMAHEKPEWVLGIDPVIHNKAQFQLINHFAQVSNLHFELLGVEHVTYFQNLFDVVFFMGIIYHHRHPLQQLIDIREALVPGGEVILETIGIPGEGTYALFPEDRYAKMRNVWFVPTLDATVNWLKRTGFEAIEVVSSHPTTEDEQRLTPWCPPPRQSLNDFLDPIDKTKTIEGYPAPWRFCLKGRKKRS